MTYPNSSPLSAGQPTAADHYNNLRLDALYLGNPSTAATLGALLQRLETGLPLEYLATARLRVPASASSPVCLVINGVPCVATSNVDLSSSAIPSGAAAQWYVFAVDTSSGTFTLSVNTSATEAPGTRLIGGFYWNGSSIECSSIHTINLSRLQANLASVNPQIANCRLTLVSNLPVVTYDVSSAGVLYLTPYLGNRLALYGNGLGWKLYELTQLSISLSSYSNKMLDVFVYDNLGTLTLELVEWTNTTTRATPLSAQDNVFVKYGAPSHRYMGSVYVTSGVAADTCEARHVWNVNNRIIRPMKKTAASDAWSYNTALTWRQSENLALSFVVGVSSDAVHFFHHSASQNGAGTYSVISIGMDSPTTSSALCTGSNNYPSTPFYMELTSTYWGFPSVGLHTAYAIELVSTYTCAIFFGTTGVPYIAFSGFEGQVLA